MKILKIISALILLIMLIQLTACENTVNVIASTTEKSETEKAPDTKDPYGVETIPLIPDITDSETKVPDDSAPDQITINELMADNGTFILGCTDDWLELYNDSDDDVVLSSYYLYRSDDPSKKLALDGKTVPSKGYAVVILDENAPFRLPKEGAELILGYKNLIADIMKYDGSIGENSLSKDGICEHPTPGYPNTASGYEEYRASVKLPGLYISEVMSSNKKYLPVSGEYYDLIELYNGSGTALNLGGYFLSDKKSEPKKYGLPDIELKAGEYLVIYCSGLSKEYHAPFKISSTGEKLYLYEGDKLTDLVVVPGDLKQNESYGRNGNRFVYMDKPTPGAANEAGYENTVPAPSANLRSGSYDMPITVMLYGEGTIYYTLDGTEPTEKSQQYTYPINVDHIASIRAFCKKDGRTSKLVSYFYVVDENHEIPIINIAIRSEYLHGDKGILNNINKDYEYESYITMMDGGVEMFSAPCGFRLHGNDSRKGDKQNFQIRFRSKYGLGTLDYPLFENREYTTFNSLLLKGGGEDYNSTCIREALCTTLVDGYTNLNTLACRPAILFLNGEYRGIYWICERYDTLYCANRLGVSRESINLLHTYGSVSAGSAANYNALEKYCRSNDLSKPEHYKYVMDRIDAYSLMDWYICRSYVGDLDLANIRFYQSTEDDGKWHWCYFDLDWSFYHNYQVAIAKVMPDNGHHVIIRSLLKNSEFRDMFLKRYAELMRTILNEKNITEKIDEFVKWMEPEIERDRAKYDLSVKKWRGYVDILYNYVKDGLRQKNILISIKSYFKLNDADMEKYFSDLLI